MRKMTSRTANYIASIVLQSNFSDLTGSFRLYKKYLYRKKVNSRRIDGPDQDQRVLISDVNPDQRLETEQENR